MNETTPWLRGLSPVENKEPCARFDGGRCCVRARGLRARRRQESSGTYIGRIRRHGPRVEITVRGDGHDGTPEVMDLPEKQGCGYILGLAGNPRINKIGRPWGDDVAVRRARSCKDKVRRFFQTG